MKITAYILIFVAFGLMIYNATFLDLEAPLHGDSATAMAGILASLIVILLMLILLVSKAIAQKAKN